MWCFVCVATCHSRGVHHVENAVLRSRNFQAIHELARPANASAGSIQSSSCKMVGARHGPAFHWVWAVSRIIPPSFQAQIPTILRRPCTAFRLVAVLSLWVSLYLCPSVLSFLWSQNERCRPSRGDSDTVTLLTPRSDPSTLWGISVNSPSHFCLRSFCSVA